MAGIYGYLDWQPPPPVWIPVALLVGVVAWRRRDHPVRFVAVALGAWVLQDAIIAVVVAQYTLAERSRRWRIALVSTVATLVVVGTPVWWQGGFDASAPVSVAICAAPALLGLYIGTRRELIAEMRERIERAEREQDLRVREARSQERTRIARDMHDVVAHRVSLMVLHATALEAENGRDAIAVAGQIGAIGRAALQELRSVVEVLREHGQAPLAPQPGLGDLTDLVEQSQSLGMRVTLAMSGTADAMPQALIEHALYRVAQEALTNVRKHADGAETHVRVHHERDRLHLTVVNSAGRNAHASTEAGLPGGGYGLLGIAERVRLVGGEFTARSTAEGGYAVEAVVPLRTDRDR